ncbi:DNA-3-methyladenine glycosylase family protein [Maricaulaceae bacterium MS644]
MTNSIHARFLDVAAALSQTLAEAMERVGPAPLPRRDETPFPEYLARAVAGQQLSVIAARSIWARVEAAAEAEGAPLLEGFHGGRAEGLRACGLSNAKVKTLIAIADAVKDGRLDPDHLANMNAVTRANALSTIWGVGQWTADMANMFWFGEEDVWPDGDVAARKTLERLTSPRRKTVRTAARFAPHRSHLAYYMWRIVDAKPA